MDFSIAGYLHEHEVGTFGVPSMTDCIKKKLFSFNLFPLLATGRCWTNLIFFSGTQEVVLRPSKYIAEILLLSVSKFIWTNISLLLMVQRSIQSTYISSYLPFVIVLNSFFHQMFNWLLPIKYGKMDLCNKYFIRSMTIQCKH